MASIKYDHVYKRFGEVTVLKDLNIDIGDQEFLVLVGPSGCGKTTALRCLAGLEEISEGNILIGDRVVNDVPPKDRDIAMVFQSYALYPHMSVYDNMAFGLKLRKTPKAEIDKRVKEAADMLSIGHLLDRKPKALSGGQRQRVALGRAIVRNPAVFLMDEPLSNLDAKLRVQTRSEISKLHQRLKTTFIYVTHDQVEAMTMGDRVAVLRKGELQQTADPQTVFDRPDNLFVATFIGSPAMNLVEAELGRHDGALVAKVGGQEFEIPASVAEERPTLRSYEGRTVALGIRPEHVEDAALVRDGGPRLRGRVILTEALGSENLAHVEVDARPVVTDEVLEIAADTDAAVVAELEIEAREDRVQIVGRFDASSRAGAGDEVELALRPERLHFFDPDTGAGIY